MCLGCGAFVTVYRRVFVGGLALFVFFDVVNFVGVGGLRVSNFYTLTPVTNITSETVERVYILCNTNFAINRLADTGNISLNSGGSFTLLDVSSGRHPDTSRLFKYSPRAVTRTTRGTLSFGPSFVSVGVNYPTPGITKGNNKDTLVGSPILTRGVMGTIIRTMGVPMAIGVQAK